MSRLILVRHGQARFLSEDYDRLSELGETQLVALAAYWVERGERADRVFCGTLERQRRSAEVLAGCYADAGAPWPAVEVLPGLDEYHADAILAGLLPELSARDPEIVRLQEASAGAQSPRDRYRTFHHLLVAVMNLYVSGDYEARGFESWKAYRARIGEALSRMTETGESGATHVAFTSGGVIGVCVQTVLGAPDPQAIELNWRIHNASITQFTFSRGRLALDCFNALPHLPDPRMHSYR